MLGVTEQGHCACAKRGLSTTTTPPKPPKDPSTVNIEELKAMIAANDIQLIDVREPYELIESGKIPNSINVPCKFFVCLFLFPLIEISQGRKESK